MANKRNQQMQQQITQSPMKMIPKDTDICICLDIDEIMNDKNLTPQLVSPKKTLEKDDTEENIEKMRLDY